MPERPVIVFVDHDPSSVNWIIERVSRRKTSTRERVQIGDAFDLRPVVVQADRKDENIAEDAAQRIAPHRPAAILVDLGFTTDEDRGSFRHGAAIAELLRDRFHPVPVGVYSQFDLKALDWVTLSMHRFAVILESLQHYLRVDKKLFPASKWLEVFSNLVAQGPGGSHAAGTLVFISHNHADATLATKVLDLLKAAFRFSASEVTATSVAGHGLRAGEDVNKAIAARIAESRCVVMLVTKNAARSAYMGYEHGLATGKRIIPLVTAAGLREGSSTPLSSVHMLRCDDSAPLHTFIQEVGDVIGRAPEKGDVLDRYIKDAVKAAKAR